MADFYVPIATGNFSDLLPQIAAGPPKVDLSSISNALENYDKGGQIRQAQDLRNVFQGGLPRDAQGNIDFGKASEMLVKAGGASQVGNLVSLQNAQIGRQVLGQTGVLPPPGSSNTGPPSSATAIPGSAPQQPAQPSAQPETTADIPTGTKMPPGQNLTGPGTTITGIDYGPTKGGGGLTPRMLADRTGGDPQAYAQSLGVGVDEVLNSNDPNVRSTVAEIARGKSQPAGSFDSRFAAATGLTLNQGQPVQGQQGLNQGQPVQPQQPTQAAQDPTALAQAYEARANYFYQQAKGLGFVNPAAAQAAKAQGDQAAQQALAIRKGLVSNTEMTTEEKNARASGSLSPRTYSSSIESDKQDNDTFQKRYTGLQAAGEQSYNGLQKVQLMKQLTTQPAFYSGPLHEGVQTFNQFRSIFGANPSSALPQEAFNKVANDLLQEQVKAMGQSGVGRVLQSEVNIMKQSIASLGITPQSNRALAEILSRVYQQNQDIADLARNVNAPPGQKNKALDDSVNGYLKQHPLFTKDEIQHPQLLGAPDAPPQSSQWSPEQKVQWAKSLGLKEGDPIRFNGQIVQVPRITVDVPKVVR